ncbi:TonB-dependent receptor [Sphingosinicella sp. CPCC 101087]|uniref:TonB-dependent receptor n=1 Tax=Sphingosinicella sp. CPCC 101087 TaxID=2497754 RepID=UPI00101C136F|nr:TonB-dependent receptor [Sphingosinicella sp. CPCC 101087]
MKTKAIFWLASVAFLPGIAHAQTTTAAEEELETPNDIVVTAQRYEQRLQDVPMSISAVTARDIQARNSELLEELQYSVPGLSTYGYGVGASSTQLRGVSNISGAATVGIYYDETPLTTINAGLDPSVKLLDLERVEVLRGPQATLYGEGSMGGVIRYIPAAPNLGSVSGWLDGEWSDTRGGAGNYVLSGAINLPVVTDVVGVRVAANYERRGGWIDRALTGERNINEADLFSVRGTLRINPTDRFDFSLLGLYQKSRQDSENFGVDGTTTDRVPTPIVDRMTFIQAKASYDLDFATLTGIGGYIDRRNTNVLDITGLLTSLLPVLGPPGFITAVPLSTASDFKIYNAELRLASQGSGPLTYAIGATYRNLKQDLLQATSTAPGTLPFVLLSASGPSRNTSYAVYGELGYEILPALTATVGARYYEEHKRRRVDQISFGTPITDLNDGKFNSFNPRFNLSYQFSRDALFYGSVAKGFRSGGFNLTSAGLAGGVVVPPTYEPDVIWTYEGGGRVSLADNRLVLDASVYRNIWTRVQTVTSAPGSPTAFTTNSGRVTGWGVDFSATARPTNALSLSATFGWNNMEYKTNTNDKLRGDPVDGAARLSYSASLDYRPELGDDVTGIFRIDYQHAGRGQITVRSFGGAGIISERPKRDLVNLRVGVALGAIELTAFASNLFNEDAPILIGPYGAIADNIEQRPRTLGISASTRF